MKNQTENPLVSIIVRTKDRPILLKKALQSIAAQTYSPIEVVLVNDGDPLPDIEYYKVILNRFIFKCLDNHKGGRTKAANLGFYNSCGDFVCFFDDDDFLYNDHISSLVFFLQNSDYKIAYTDSRFVILEYDSSSERFIQVKSYLAPTMDFSRETLFFYNYIPFMCLMFHRDVINEVGVFDEEFELCEDWDLIIRISKTYPFYHIKKVTSEYNIWNRETQSILNNERLFVFRKKIYQKHISELTPEIIANFIFNGYWINIIFLEDKVSILEQESVNVKQELVNVKQELVNVKNEYEALAEKNRDIVEENNIVKSENKLLFEKIISLENHIRTNTIRFPKNIKKAFKFLLGR